MKSLFPGFGNDFSKYDRERFTRWSRSISILGLLLALVFFFVNEEIVYGFDEIFYYFIGVSLTISVSSLLYWYLELKPVVIKSDYSSNERLYEKIENAIEVLEDIEYALSIIENSGSEKTTWQFIFEKVDFLKEKHGMVLDLEYSYITNTRRVEFFKRDIIKLKEKTKDKLNRLESEKNNRSDDKEKSDNSIENMLNIINFMTSRLKEEVAQLNKRGNIYILVGSIMTMVAAVVLYTVVQDIIRPELNDGLKLSVEEKEIGSYEIVSIFSRFSLVIFVEVFAFYYLRLYRSIMDNIKFYQNEMTNIEMKVFALHAIEKEGDVEHLMPLVDQLSKTERNFVITKNQTTIDIEKHKVDSNILSSSFDQVAKIINGIKK